LSSYHLDRTSFPTRRSSDLNLKRILLIIVVLSLVIVAGCSPTFIFNNEDAEPRNEPSIGRYTVPPNFIPQALVITALGDSLSQRSEEHTSELQSRENLVCRL